MNDMQLTKYSINRIRANMQYWEVDDEWKDVIVNYLVHGFEPGGFFVALLANDARMMILKSHPANTIPAMKALMGFLGDYKDEFWGSYEIVEAWLGKSAAEKREVLERIELVYTPQQEVMFALKDRNHACA